jgi:uncharacterized membrane protein YebE (DUF533 family)
MAIDQIPIYKPAERRKKKLSDVIQSPKTSPKRPGPSGQTEDDDSPGDKTTLTKGLAGASAAISGRGRVGRLLKAGLAGAAAGHELEKSYKAYKAKRAKKKGKEATTTVSQSAMEQKARWHKKDETNTEKP